MNEPTTNSNLRGSIIHLLIEIDWLEHPHFHSIPPKTYPQIYKFVGKFFERLYRIQQKYLAI